MSFRLEQLSLKNSGSWNGSVEQDVIRRHVDQKEYWIKSLNICILALSICNLGKPIKGFELPFPHLLEATSVCRKHPGSLE